MLQKWKRLCVHPANTLGDAIRAIDENSVQIALVVDHDRLCGTLTDGDVRRALLRGTSLQDPVTCAMNASPKTALAGDNREAIVARMRQLSIRQIPIVDAEGVLVGLEILDELLTPSLLANRVVLMAGGFGRRLSPLTDDCPKPMLPIGGRPILETVLLNLVEYGFRNFSLSVNYKSEMIEDYFGNGSRWGVNIDYLHEPRPLGTAGALCLLPETPSLPIVVMNGDILTKVNFNHLLQFHTSHASRATMCVRDYELQVPYGVVKIDGYQILEIQEKPTQKFFVNAGIYVLEPEILELIPREERLDMTELFQKAIDTKKAHAVFPVREYWVDIGRHADLDNARLEFGATFR